MANTTENKARRMSELYYNQGLDSARVRNLSGAAHDLRMSLAFDKDNTDARNLLGLIYHETGETVAALSQWIISRNRQPQGNPATYFLNDLRADKGRLQELNETIRQYNQALEACRAGDEDMAAVTLRRAVAQNTRFVRAYQLLALIEIREGKYTHASRMLQRTLQIDRTNPVSLRYLQEIREITGQSGRRRGRAAAEPADAGEENAGRQNPRPLPFRFRETSSLYNLMNIIIGAVLGLLVAVMVAGPAIRYGANRKADLRVVEYTNTMASQNQEIQELSTALKNTQDTLTLTETSLEQSEKEATSYKGLMDAYLAYRNQDSRNAAQALATIDVSQLSGDAKSVYDMVYAEVKEDAFGIYNNDGQIALANKDYEKAIENLELAKAIHGDNYPVLYYLAISYQMNGQLQEAYNNFRLITERFAGTDKASTAQQYMKALENTGKIDKNAGTAAAAADAAAGDAGTAGDAGAGEAGTAGTDGTGNTDGVIPEEEFNE